MLGLSSLAQHACSYVITVLRVPHLASRLSFRQDLQSVACELWWRTCFAAIYSAHLKLHPLLVLSVLVIAEHSLGVWGLLLAGVTSFLSEPLFFFFLGMMQISILTAAAVTVVA